MVQIFCRNLNLAKSKEKFQDLNSCLDSNLDIISIQRQDFNPCPKCSIQD